MKKLQKNEQRIHRIADELEKQQLDNSYKNDKICEKLRISTATFHRYKPKAMLEVQKRHEFELNLKNQAITHEVTEAAKNGLFNGLLSDTELEQILCKIAEGKMDITETTSTPDGIIEFNRKPTPNEIIAAIKEIYKKRGSYAPEKVESIISAYNVTLNLNK
jgi:hypothetical protein